LNTKQYLEKLDVERSWTAIHNWIQKADLQPADGANPNRVAVDETAIQFDSDRFWLYAAVDPRTNEFLYVDVFPVQYQQLTLMFLRGLREKHHVDNAFFLVDAGGHLTAALSRTSLRFQITRHGNRYAVEPIFGEVKRSIPLVFKYVQKCGADGGRIMAPSLRRLLEPMVKLT